MKTSKNLLKIVLAGLLITSVVGANAEQVCCPAGTVAYCQGKCCQQACDSQDKCPTCPDDGTLGTDNETCCKDGHSYVEGSGYTGTSDACKQCIISSDCEGKLDVAEDECVDCIQGECKAVKQNDDKWCCNSKTGYTWTGTGCCLFSKSILLSDGTKVCCKEDEEVVNEECCPSDRVAEVNGVKSCCLTSEHVSYDGIGNARCCPQGKEAASDGTCCADEERALKKDGSFACCASDDYSSETCCSHNGKTWVNNKCEDCPENAKYEENAECFCGQNPRDLRCCESTNVAKHGTTQECCTSDETKTTLLNGTDTYCCPTASAGFVIDSGKCCSQTSSYFYSEENEDCFCANNPEDSRCLKCPETCPSDSLQKTNSYCMMLTGKDLTALKQCIDDKVSGITIDSGLSSFEFSVSTGLFSSSKKYKVSFALDKMFCGVVDESSLSVTQESGQKVCYADIEDVVSAFSGYMEKIKDKCFNEDIFYMVMDSFIEGSSDLSPTVKKMWSCCKINLLKDKIITSQLNTRLTELLQDCNRGLYCNTSDCMKSCCSSYKEDSSGNPIVTQECCESIKGEYSELSGNQVQCCTDCKAPSSAFLDFGDYVKELFGIKTAYAEESGMCIISCKEGYVKVGDSVACCPANGEKEVTLGSDGETCCSDGKAYKDGSYSDGTDTVCGCPEETTASGLDPNICCKNDKPGYFLYKGQDKGQEELATNGQICGCPSPGSSPDSTSQWCCYGGKATTPGSTNDDRIDGSYKFINNLTVQECGCPDNGDKKSLGGSTYTCCKDGYEISISDDSLTYAYNSVTASSIRLCQCPAGGTKGKLNDYCCKNGYGMKLTLDKEAVYPVDYSLYQRSSDIDIDTVKECGCPLLKDLVGDTCCDFNTGKAYNPVTDKYDTEDITCCKNIAEHNTTKECCKGSTPNKTTVLNGTDSYCCPNDKKDFVTDQGKCCSNSATYDSDKDCFCAKNPNDSKCSVECKTGYKQCPGESFCVSESSCCPGDKYTGDYADDYCVTCEIEEQYQYNYWNMIGLTEDESCCLSKGKKWCSATESYSSIECVDMTGENSCCTKDKPDGCRTGRRANCTCDNGIWKPLSGYKQCKNGSIVSETTCCSGEKPTDYDATCYDCDSATGEYVLDKANNVEKCGCPDSESGAIWTGEDCCKGDKQLYFGEYNRTSWACACYGKGKGTPVKTTHDLSTNTDTPWCILCNGEGGYSNSLERSSDYTHFYQAELASCCSILGGEVCDMSEDYTYGDDYYAACVFGNNYKCCHDTRADGSSYPHVAKCCLSSLPEGLEKSSCYSCSQDGRWVKDNTARYYKNGFNVGGSYYSSSGSYSGYVYDAAEGYSCETDKCLGIYDMSDFRWIDSCPN